MSHEHRQSQPPRRPYQRPEIARVRVDPVTDLLSHGAKADASQLGCGSDPAHHSPS